MHSTISLCGSIVDIQRRLRLGEEKEERRRKKEDETTTAKYNGLPITVGGYN